MIDKLKFKYFISYSYFNISNAHSGFDNCCIEYSNLDDFSNLTKLEKELAKKNKYSKVKIIFYKVIDNSDYLHNF